MYAIVTATATGTAQFVETEVGVNVYREGGEQNLIHWQSGVQIWSGWSYRDGELHTGGFWVGVPAHVRNTGVRAIDYRRTLGEAVEYAATLVPDAERKMIRRHTDALRADKRRAA